MFVNRATSFDIDRVLAAQNNSGASTSSYGLFDNDEEMALNLGFTGFRIGYDFYKSDWKYLNDATTRGGSSTIDGILVPAGTTTVYDQVLGQNAKRPFLHVRYRQSPWKTVSTSLGQLVLQVVQQQLTRIYGSTLYQSVHFVLWVLTTSSC